MCGITASPRQGWLHGNVRYCRRATIPAVISHHRSVHVQHPSSRENEAPARMSISPPSVCGGTPKGVTITQVVLPGVRMVIKHLDRDQIAMICITSHPASGYSERHKALSGGNGGQFRGLRRTTHLMQHGQLGKRCISLVERRHWEIPPPLSYFSSASCGAPLWIWPSSRPQSEKRLLTLRTSLALVGSDAYVE